MGLICSSFVLGSISHVSFLKFKIGNQERGWPQVAFLNTETPTNQDEDEGGIVDVIRHYTVSSYVNVGNFYCRRVSYNYQGEFNYFRITSSILTQSYFNQKGCMICIIDQIDRSSNFCRMCNQVKFNTFKRFFCGRSSRNCTTQICTLIYTYLNRTFVIQVGFSK